LHFGCAGRAGGALTGDSRSMESRRHRTQQEQLPKKPNARGRGRHGEPNTDTPRPRPPRHRAADAAAAHQGAKGRGGSRGGGCRPARRAVAPASEAAHEGRPVVVGHYPAPVLLLKHVGGDRPGPGVGAGGGMRHTRHTFEGEGPAAARTMVSASQRGASPARPHMRGCARELWSRALPRAGARCHCERAPNETPSHMRPLAHEAPRTTPGPTPARPAPRTCPGCRPPPPPPCTSQSRSCHPRTRERPPR
jgi:hypothetical protein